MIQRMAPGIALQLGTLFLGARDLFIRTRDLFISARELFVGARDQDVRRTSLFQVRRGMRWRSLLSPISPA
jgi:hypothetical protein